MSAPRITLPLIAAARPFARLRIAVRAALKAGLDEAAGAGLLAGMGAPAWTDGDEALGFSVPAGEGAVFLGLYLGPESVLAETPDLSFYVQVPRGSHEQEAADARAEEITAVTSALNRLGLQIYWGYTPGGAPGLWAVMSLADALRSGDPEASARQFVLHTLSQAREAGLLAVYLGPSFRPAPEDEGTS